MRAPQALSLLLVAMLPAACGSRAATSHPGTKGDTKETPQGPVPTCGDVPAGRVVLELSPADRTAPVPGGCCMAAELTLPDPNTPPWVDELQARFKLVTWPERAEVPAKITVFVTSNQTVQLSLGADMPLAERRYAVILDGGLPPETTGQLALSTLPGHHIVLDDGTVAARFYTGSHPEVRLISFCALESQNGQPPPDGIQVRAELTEDWHIQPNATAADYLRVSQHGTALRCVETSAENHPDGIHPGWTWLTCPPLDPSALVTLDMNGVVGSSGHAFPDLHVTAGSADRCVAQGCQWLVPPETE